MDRLAAIPETQTADDEVRPVGQRGEVGRDQPHLCNLRRAICAAEATSCTLGGGSGRRGQGLQHSAVQRSHACLPPSPSPPLQVRGWAVSALGKLAAQAGRPLTRDAAALVEGAARAESVELQQRALEVAALLRAPAATQRATLPYDAAAEDVGVDPQLPFLEGFVQQVCGGGR